MYRFIMLIISLLRITELVNILKNINFLKKKNFWFNFQTQLHTMKIIKPLIFKKNYITSLPLKSNIEKKKVLFKPKQLDLNKIILKLQKFEISYYNTLIQDNGIIVKKKSLFSFFLLKPLFLDIQMYDLLIKIIKKKSFFFNNFFMETFILYYQPLFLLENQNFNLIHTKDNENLLNSGAYAYYDFFFNILFKNFKFSVATLIDDTNLLSSCITYYNSIYMLSIEKYFLLLQTIIVRKNLWKTFQYININLYNKKFMFLFSEIILKKFYMYEQNTILLSTLFQNNSNVFFTFLKKNLVNFFGISFFFMFFMVLLIFYNFWLLFFFLFLVYCGIFKRFLVKIFLNQNLIQTVKTSVQTEFFFLKNYTVTQYDDLLFLKSTYVKSSNLANMNSNVEELLDFKNDSGKINMSENHEISILEKKFYYFFQMSFLDYFDYNFEMASSYFALQNSSLMHITPVENNINNKKFFQENYDLLVNEFEDKPYYLSHNFFLFLKQLKIYNFNLKKGGLLNSEQEKINLFGYLNTYFTSEPRLIQFFFLLYFFNEKQYWHKKYTGISQFYFFYNYNLLLTDYFSESINDYYFLKLWNSIMFYDSTGKDADRSSYENKWYKINYFNNVLLYYDLYLYEEIFLKNFFFNDIINFDEINYYLDKQSFNTQMQINEVQFSVKNNNLYYFYENTNIVSNIFSDLASNKNTFSLNNANLSVSKSLKLNEYDLIYYNITRNNVNNKKKIINRDLQYKNIIKSSKKFYFIQTFLINIVDVVSSFLDSNILNLNLMQKDFFYSKNNIWSNGVLSWTEFLESHFLIQENVNYLEMYKKKIYKLIIFELEREKKFFFKQFNISKNLLMNSKKRRKFFFYLMLQKKIPRWIYDQHFYNYEIMKRYNKIISYLYKTLILQQDYFMANDFLYEPPSLKSNENYSVLLKNEFYNLLWYDSINNVISVSRLNNLQEMNLDLFLRTMVNINLILTSLNSNLIKIENLNEKIFFKLLVLYPYIQYATMNLKFLTLKQKLVLYKNLFNQLQTTVCFDFELFCQQNSWQNISLQPEFLVSYYFTKYPFLPYYINEYSQTNLLNFLNIINNYNFYSKNIFQSGSINYPEFFSETTSYLPVDRYYFEFFLLYFVKQTKETEKYFIDFIESENGVINHFLQRRTNLTNYNFHNIYNIANINYNNSIWDESTIRTEMELKSGDWRHYDSEYAKYSDSSFARLQPFFEIEKQLLTITQNEFFFPLYFSTTLHNEVDLDYDLSMPVGWC